MTLITMGLGVGSGGDTIITIGELLDGAFGEDVIAADVADDLIEGAIVQDTLVSGMENL